jgi:hypothetical protein
VTTTFDATRSDQERMTLDLPTPALVQMPHHLSSENGRRPARLDQDTTFFDDSTKE